MTADAVVVAARADGRVDLEFRPRSCSACAGTCLWKRLQTVRIERLRAAGLTPGTGLASGTGVKPGTEVTVTLPERRVLQASLLLHGLPLAAILTGAAAGAALTATDAGTLTGALAGLAAALAVSKPLGHRLERATLSHLVVTPKP